MFPVLDEHTRRTIREAYSNTSNFCDGDIYRHARQCNLAGDVAREHLWLARLSESKRRDVLQLQRLAEKDERMKKFRDVLDSLLPFVGLWSALKIGTFHRLLTLRCPEEMTHYLVRVRESWRGILGGQVSIFPYLDSHTVTVVQGKNTFLSSEDSHLIEQLLLQREIFSSDVFDNERPTILLRLQSIKHIIPSLHTFLEDTKYLEPCAKIMKSILPPGFKGSVSDGFTHQHNGCFDWCEQLCEDHRACRRSSSGLQARWHSYRQLWLFTWRHFPVMIGQAPRKDDRKAQGGGKELQCGWWHELSKLASTCGYGNMRNMYPDVDELMFRDFLRNARPPQFYRLDEEDIKDKVKHLKALLADIQRRPSETETPALSSDCKAFGSDITSRCGRPFEQSFKDDAPYLFLQHVYHDCGRGAEHCRKRYLTTFAVKRDIFCAFFGDAATPDTTIQGSDAGPTPSPQPSADTLQPHSDPATPKPTTPPLSTPAQASSALTLAHEDPIENSSELVHSASAWHLAQQYLRPPQNNVLTIISPVSPYDETSFRVERPSVEGILDLTKVLDVRGQNIEHVYMSHSTTAGLKFIDGKTIVRQVGQFKNHVIFKIPVGIVDKLKHQYEAMTSVS